MNFVILTIRKKQSWLLVPTILFQVLFLLILSPQNLYAREKFEISIGEKIQVLSDKAFRKSKENKFEAVGNVIITYTDKAIYGEKASISFQTGHIKVVGNVRYVAPEMTMYGSELNYNFKKKELIVKNSRILSDNYVVLGKEIKKESSGVITSQDAEYTTCKDCPESWSIFGRRVRVTVGEYVRIWHAYIKAKGVVIMYIPYIVLPIKKNRESGVLFPRFAIGDQEGVRFQIPYFWALGESADLTVTPSILGRRGYGSELQYRQVFAERTWFDIDSIHSLDKIYAPFKESLDDTGDTVYRYFANYEHHFATSEYFNHHLNLTTLNDLDAVRDFDFYSLDWVKAPDIGASSFLEFRADHFNLGVESDLRRNQLFQNPKGIDHSYVQILPRIRLSTSPMHVYQSKYPFLKRISMGVDGDYTVFKQNHNLESQYIRNALRLNARPYVRWDFGNLGPVNLTTQASYDYQHYRFNRLETNKFFSKSGITYKTDISFSLDKKFGVSYVQNVPTTQVKKINKKNKKKEIKKDDDFIIGDIPSFDQRFKDDTVVIKKNSFRHSQDVIFRHYFLSDQLVKGNRRFEEQIKSQDGIGQFDYIDAIRSREHLVNQQENLITLPQRNTIELQWNHSLIKKEMTKPIDYSISDEPLRNIFNYSKVAFFNLSQGYDLDKQDGSTSERLTRLSVNTGLNNQNFSLSVNEYYFYALQKHIFNVNYAHRYSWGNWFARYNYDSLSLPVRKLASVGANLGLIERFNLYAAYDFDFEDTQNTGREYGVIYMPYNNCWRLDFNYRRDLLEKRVSFNFLINFNEQGFTSFNGQ